MFDRGSARMSSIVVMPPAAVISCLRGGAQTPEPIEIGALHHAFFVDVGAQESAAEGLQPADHFFGGEIRRLLPALDHDLAVFRIERDR